MNGQENTKKSLVEIFKEIIRKVFSKTDNYTIEEYLKILSEFTDSVIRDSKNENLTFVGGEVIIKSLRESKKVKINVEMEFKTIDNQWELKKAERMIDYSTFNNDSIERIEANQELRYKVENLKDEVK